MEETLTDCLVRVREDLSQLKKVRDYLDTNTETEERCSVTWRTIEAFNSILSVCSSQNTPETNALDTLLDSFYYLARNNSDDCVWDDFGFELGIICVKVLSAIERCEIFEILFCKLLSVISIICEHNSNVWKAAARQVLNVLINKKFSLSYLEAIVKLYICILNNIDGSTLTEFSSQNLHLLKTFSLLVEKVGDFEIQSSVIELVFLHLSRDKKLMSDFFSTTDTKLFQSLPFADFEHDCRLYLNAVNKRGFERKVYSICCHVLYLGGCFMEPPLGKNSLWVDLNKDSERMSIKCGDDNGNRVILVQFSEMVNVHLEKDKTESNRCLTIQTKNLTGLHKDARNDDICLVVENAEDVYEFVRFLETTIANRKRKKKLGRRTSKTADFLVIDRNSPRLEVQDNAVTSSERPGIDHILPDVLSLFEKANQTKVKSPPQSQQLSPNSFVESLNKHIGLGSPELRHTFEDSIETIEFLQKTTPVTSHKLFRSPEKVFDVLENAETDLNFVLGENKKNLPKTKMKTYSRGPSKPEPSVLTDRKNIQIKITNMHSQDYFRTDSSVLMKRKPCLPKIKRNPKQSNNHKQKLDASKESKVSPKDKEKQNGNKSKGTETENPKEKSKQIQTRQKIHENKPRAESKLDEKQNAEKPKTENPTAKPNENKQNPEGNPFEPKNMSSEPKDKPKSNGKLDRAKKHSKPEVKQKKQTSNPKAKPSLLDPNGYAYQRWCKPTTSERSKFWLRKLEILKKHSKMDSDSVFDFSEDSDSIYTKRKSRKRVVHSKPELRTSQMSLQRVKEILKKSSPKGVRVSSTEKKRTAPTEATEPITTNISKSSSSPDSIPEGPADSEYESLSGEEEPPAAATARNREHSDEEEPPTAATARNREHSDEEEPPAAATARNREHSDEEEPPAAATARNREHSDEDSSSKRCTKKKSKTAIPTNVLSILRRRLRMAEEKDRQQTDEIIQTINKATNHLFSHLQRKEGERAVSYLREADEASAAFGGYEDDLNLRLKRIHRAVLYYQTGCSVADFCEALDGHLSKVREALKEYRQKKDSSKTIERVHVRLSDLIKSEIERTIGDEWESKRNRLLRCATILGTDIKELG